MFEYIDEDEETLDQLVGTAEQLDSHDLSVANNSADCPIESMISRPLLKQKVVLSNETIVQPPVWRLRHLFESITPSLFVFFGPVEFYRQPSYVNLCQTGTRK